MNGSGTYYCNHVLPVNDDHDKFTSRSNLPVTPTSESNHTSPTVLRDPGNVGVAAGISLLSYIQAEIRTLHMYFRLMAAIFDLPVTSTSESICNSSNVLLNPENVGVADGISLLSYTQAEI